VLRFVGATADGIAAPGVAAATEPRPAMPATGGGTDALPAGFSDGALLFTGDGYTAPGKVDGTPAETSLTTAYQVLRPQVPQRAVAERGC
jgi:hypothetical protein